MRRRMGLMGRVIAAGIALATLPTGMISVLGVAPVQAAGRAVAGITAPATYTSADFLGAITATSANSAWAVGCNGSGRSFILHWDGTRWR